MVTGLNSVEVKRRLADHGYNELPSSRPRNIFRIALDVIREPMFLLLISCGGLYMVLGDYREGGIMLATIFIIIAITFFQSRKTERALDALRKLASPRVMVIRDGEVVRVPGREVVPGDVMILNEGDRIAADARILDSSHLMADESLLTGESLPVMKNASVNQEHPQGLVYSGTLVVKGRGTAEVIYTGLRTRFGKIGESLGQVKEEETRLQKELRVLILRLFLIGGIICIGIVALYYWTRGQFLQSLLNGLAAAMAILPEEFPVVLTIFMALGAWRLSKNKVLTRKPSAIETLGAATVLCSDKTGTITLNQMEVACLYNGSQILERTEILQEGAMTGNLVQLAAMASPSTTFDPMEKAIRSMQEKLQMPDEAALELVKEYPLSHQLLALTRVFQSRENDPFSIAAKGAPEAIFSLCRLEAEEISRHTAALLTLAAKGYRVLGIARGTWHNPTLPEDPRDLIFQFEGLIGFEDPVRPEVPQAIKECKTAGIRVIMITGDYPETARNIAAQAGLDIDGDLITGEELDRMPDQELQERIRRTVIFARVVPEQKLRIVQALKANKEMVAMTGDGINDAPALKAAHIGIAMGNKGTDVAREASSLVLLDDNFASIVEAIRSGRRIFDNLQKAMSYIMAIHIPIIGLTLIPAFIPGIPLLLMPLHIVFMELIIDPVCSVAFESEQEEKGIMNRKPRNLEQKFFGRDRLSGSLLQGFLLLGLVVTVYWLSLKEGHTDGEIRAIAFSSLIVGNMFLILTNLSKTRSFLNAFTEGSKITVVILLAASILLLLILSLPPLQMVFSFEDPGYMHFIPALLGSLAMLVILEGVKFARIRSRGL